MKLFITSETVKVDLRGYFFLFAFGLSVFFLLPGFRINMFVQTAAKAQVTLKGSVDTGYIRIYNSVVMFKSRYDCFQRRAKGQRQIS